MYVSDIWIRFGYFWRELMLLQYTLNNYSCTLLAGIAPPPPLMLFFLTWGVNNSVIETMLRAFQEVYGRHKRQVGIHSAYSLAVHTLNAPSDVVGAPTNDNDVLERERGFWHSHTRVEISQRSSKRAFSAHHPHAFRLGNWPIMQLVERRQDHRIGKHD